MSHDDLGRGGVHLVGTPASPGIARGAVGFFQQEEKQLFSVPTILVAETIPPSIQSLDTNVVGIVTAEGGLLSHAACIARELGIPCVVGVGEGYDALEHVVALQVDGDKGEVREIDRRENTGV